MLRRREILNRVTSTSAVWMFTEDLGKEITHMIGVGDRFVVA